MDKMMYHYIDNVIIQLFYMCKNDFLNNFRKLVNILIFIIIITIII